MGFRSDRIFFKFFNHKIIKRRKKNYKKGKILISVLFSTLTSTELRHLTSASSSVFFVQYYFYECMMDTKYKMSEVKVQKMNKND